MIGCVGNCFSARFRVFRLGALLRASLLRQRNRFAFASLGEGGEDVGVPSGRSGCARCTRCTRCTWPHVGGLWLFFWFAHISRHFSICFPNKQPPVLVVVSSHGSLGLVARFVKRIRRVYRNSLRYLKTFVARGTRRNRQQCGPFQTRVVSCFACLVVPVIPAFASPPLRRRLQKQVPSLIHLVLVLVLLRRLHVQWGGLRDVWGRFREQLAYGVRCRGTRAARRRRRPDVLPRNPPLPYGSVRLEHEPLLLTRRRPQGVRFGHERTRPLGKRPRPSPLRRVPRPHAHRAVSECSGDLGATHSAANARHAEINKRKCQSV